VLLTILGVPHETVVQDYLLSNNYRGVDPNANSEAAMLTGGVHASWLESAFAAAESEYGSFDAYVREGLGITDQDVAALKGKLLQSFDLADQVERAIG
jgi:protein-tyrosine phosphatase